MKKLLFALLAVSIVTTLLPCMVNAQSTKSSASALNGSWKRIAVIVNGKAEVNPPEQYRLFHDGILQLQQPDTSSPHAWKNIFGGTYEISNHIYKENCVYSSVLGLAGSMHWQELTIKGDTASFKLFVKMIDASGKELLKPTYTRELVCVRMKK